MLTASTSAEAWSIARRLLPDCAKDHCASERAGYPVYRSTHNFYGYICDLGNRLEINMPDNSTINIAY